MADTEQVVAQNGEAEQTTEVVESTQEGAGDAGAVYNPEDDDERKLFVGGLSWETTEKDLNDYFAKFGAVKSCLLKIDFITKQSRCFGFVVYEESATVDKVLETKDHALHGKTIDPKRAKPRGPEPVKKIFVGKLDPTTPETDVREYFSKYGKVEKVDLPYDKTKDQRRNFCFVEYDSPDSVTAALAESGHTINGQELDVKKATPNSGGRGRGRGGFGGGWGARGGGGGRGGYGGGWGNQGWGYGGQGYGYGGGWGGNQGYYDYGYDQSYYGGGGGWDYGQGYYGVLKAGRKGTSNRAGTGRRRGGAGAVQEGTGRTEQENGN